MRVDTKPRIIKPAFGSVRVDWGHPLARAFKHGLVLNEGGGTRVLDIASVNNGTLGSAMSWTQSARGVGITASVIDQTNALVSFGPAVNLDIPSTLGASVFIVFSISVAGGAAHSLFSIRDSVADSPVFDVEVGYDGVDNSGTDKLAALVRDNGGAGILHIHGATILTPNVTYAALVTCQMSGSKALTIYLNGVQDASGAHTMTAGISGNTKQWANESRNSLIQNIRGKIVLGYFWLRELSAAEAVWLFAEPYAFLRPVPAMRYWSTPAAAVVAAGSVVRPRSLSLLGVGS